MTEATKFCRDCNEDIPISEFGCDLRSRDGLKGLCRKHWNKRYYVYDRKTEHPRVRVCGQCEIPKKLGEFPYDSKGASERGSICSTCRSENRKQERTNQVAAAQARRIAFQWTLEEDQVLRDRYERTQKQDLMRLLPGRTPESINRRARRLGLKKDMSVANRHPSFETVFKLPLSECDLAYLAALVDGEGCINLGKARTFCLPRPWSYQAKVSISNTNPKLISWLYESLNGFIYKQPLKDGHKQSWNFTVFGESVVCELLQAILPHLKIKSEQAQLLADGWLDKSQDELEAIKQRLNVLNRRGSFPKYPLAPFLQEDEE